MALLKQYSASTMAIKGLSSAMIVGLIAWIVNAISTGDWTPTEDVKATVTIIATAVISGLYVAFRNWLKNYAGVDLGAWFGLFVAVCFLSSCASMTPALGGKTKVETNFRDFVTAEGGQDTTYSQTISAPAGVEVKELSSMNYDWTGEGAGKIGISQDRGANTLGQAEALIQVNAQQTQLINSLVTAIVQTAAPIVGMKVQGDVQNQAASIANRAQLQALIADMVSKAIAAQQPPANPLPVNPLVDEVRLPR